MKELKEVICEINHKILWVTVNKYALFLKYGKLGTDALVLYMHLQFTAELQRTNEIKATKRYCQNGLGWSRERIEKARALLIQLKLIEEKNIQDEKGKFIGKKIILKHTPVPEEPDLNSNDNTGNGQTLPSYGKSVIRENRHTENSNKYSTINSKYSTTNKNNAIASQLSSSPNSEESVINCIHGKKLKQTEDISPSLSCTDSPGENTNGNSMNCRNSSNKDSTYNKDINSPCSASSCFSASAPCPTSLDIRPVLVGEQTKKARRKKDIKVEVDGKIVVIKGEEVSKKLQEVRKWYKDNWIGYYHDGKQAKCILNLIKKCVIVGIDLKTILTKHKSLYENDKYYGSLPLTPAVTLSHFDYIRMRSV